MLAGPHVEHLAPEVWQLKQQPVALHHLAGQAFAHAEALHDVLAVIDQFVHLTAQVLPLKDLDPELTSVLFWGRGHQNQELEKTAEKFIRSTFVFVFLELPWRSSGKT